MLRKFIAFITLVMILTVSSTKIFGQDIQVSHDSLMTTVGTGDSTVRSLTIENTGTDTLKWSIKVKNLSGQNPTRPAKLYSGVVNERTILKNDYSSPVGQKGSKIIYKAPVFMLPMVSAQAAPASAGSILLIDDGGSASDITPILTNAGYSVTTVSDDVIYDGTNPSPDGFSAVILTDGVSYGGDMPVSGQDALVNYVNNGGGLLFTEWIAYEYSSGRYTNFGSLISVPRSEGFTASETYTVLESHPITSGLPSSFSIPIAGGNIGQAIQGTVLISGSSSGAAVVLSQIGQGKVVQFSTAANYGGYQPFADQNMQTLLLNTVNWISSGSWLSAEPNEGFILPGQSTPVTIQINASHLEPGDYDAQIAISSNDTLDTLVIVPVHLKVTPAVIDVAVNNLTVDVKSADSVITNITIGNTGTGYLKWNASVSEPEGEAPVVELMNPSGSVKAGTNQDLQMILHAGTVTSGTYNFTLNISSNDTANPNKSVSLDITVLPPIFSSTPDSFGATIGAGDSVKQTLTISNTGTGNLTWDISVSSSLPQRLGNKAQSKFDRPIKKTFVDGAGSKLPHSKNIITPTKNLTVSNSVVPGYEDRKILVIQNFDAWGVVMSDFILQNFGITPTVITSGDIAITDFSQYDLIITTGDQDDGFYYPALSANVAKFEDFISTGGVVQYQLATQGENVDIAGGVSVTYGNSENFNRVLAPDHPIVTGLDSLLEGGSANHCYLTNLPQEAVIITETQLSQLPTTAEYLYGAGRVIVTGMTWEYLYYNEYNSAPMMGKAIEYSLSVAKGNWLSSNPKSGLVAPSGNQNVEIKLDASNLLPGNYDAYLLLNTNDPQNNFKGIPAHLTVLAPVVGLSTNNLTMNIGAADSGTTSFSISNTGLGFLKWSASATGELGPNVRFTPNKGSVAAGTPQNIEVKLLPVDMPGDYSFDIHLTTNDTANLNVTIPVTVHILAPSIGISPDSFAVKLELGDSTSQTLTINNTGSGKLKWNILVQDVSENSARAPKDNNLFSTKNFTSVAADEVLHPRSNRPNKNGTLSKASLFEKLRLAEAAAIPGDFSFKASSPLPLTCVTVDPRTNIIYAQENGGYGFYKYDPKTDQWTDLTACPLSSGNNGGATYWDGKIYTCYTGLDSLGIYDIAGDSWTTMGNAVTTGNIEAVNGYIYLAGEYAFNRFNTVNAQWDTLTAPGTLFPNFDGENNWGGLKYYNGYLYNFNGNGDTAFAKYNINSQEWTLLPGLPGGAVLGSAIDPVTHKLFAYGDYDGNNWYAFDLIAETWSVTTLSMFPAGGGGGERAMAEEWSYLDDGGMAYVSAGPTVGVYFVEGEGGTGLAVFETPRGETWVKPDVASGLVSASGSQSVTLKINADTLAVGDYRALITITSNDTGKPALTIPVTMKIRTDATGPRISVSFFQDNYLTQYVDVIATASEPLGSAAVIEVTKPDNSTLNLPIDTVDIVNNVYYSHFKLDQSGTFSFRTTATDTAGNSADTSRSLSAALGKANTVSKLISADAASSLTVGENSLSQDAYLTVTHSYAPLVINENERAVSDLYTFGPENINLESSVTITFDYSKIQNANESHLVIYQKTPDGFAPIKSSVNRNSKIVSAAVNKLGQFQLFYNASVQSDDERVIPKQFSLYQNYPNPFNPSTTIRFDLPARGKVNIAVYNILGQQVRTLIDREYEAGTYSVTWDGKNDRGRIAASGIYIYQIQTDKFTQARKMLFLK